MPKPYIRIAGIDEAGRGPLAGPVTAAAVILSPEHPIEGLADSKKLTASKRELLSEEIKQVALGWGLGWASAAEIDAMNILQASLLAMQRAVAAMAVKPEKVLVDGIHCPVLPCATQAIIKGDQKIAVISAASILAKVARDQKMLAFDQQYPGYGLAQHKGYPTKAHIESLHKLGPTTIHRRSFAPVRAVLDMAESWV